jgi:hypothetical protein
MTDELLQQKQVGRVTISLYGQHEPTLRWRVEVRAGVLDHWCLESTYAVYEEALNRFEYEVETHATVIAKQAMRIGHA